MKERITILLGAGAMIESTQISTNKLTEIIIQKCKKYKIDNTNNDSIVDVICDKFLSIYHKEVSLLPKNLSKIEQIVNIISFEDIFHAIELLPNYNKKSGYKSHASVYNIFSEISKDFETLDYVSIYGAVNEIINTINDEIYAYDVQYSLNGQKFDRFFNLISNSTGYSFDVFNLNYDTWIEQALINYNDGFVDIPKYQNQMQRFDINEYMKVDDRHTISHLHGQICFEYPDFKNEDINMFAFQESHNTLYKYLDFSLAKNYRLRSAHSSDRTQSGENLFRTNIVTGLMKTDKLLWNPLNAYHNKLMNSLISNKRLILIGYGFSDLYINNLLYQYNSCHFNDRKVLMIDYINTSDWQPQIEHPFNPSEKAVFTNVMFKDEFWCRRHPFYSKQDLYVSPDKMACICTSGFFNVINKYMTQVIQFIK